MFLQTNPSGSLQSRERVGGRRGRRSRKERSRCRVGAMLTNRSLPSYCTMDVSFTNVAKVLLQ